MQLVTLDIAGVPHPGVLTGDELLDLRACGTVIPAARCIPDTVKGILAAGEDALQLVMRIRDRILEDHGALAEQLRARGALHPRARAVLRAPILDPQMILAGGLNYREHLEEMNTPVPEKPVSFVKSSAAIIGPDEPIVLPRACPDKVDFEGEFSAVFGRICHNVEPAEALDCIAGYTIINDVSARDWVAPIFAATGVMGPIHAWEHNLLGKQFPSFCPLGPALVTRDEVGDPNALELTTTLNGKVMQSANTSDLVFSLTALIAYYSRFYRFLPGDIITTGSPSGVGYGRKPQIFMRPGDRIEVSVQGVGVLSNRVVGAEPRSG